MGSVAYSQTIWFISIQMEKASASGEWRYICSGHVYYAEYFNNTIQISPVASLLYVDGGKKNQCGDVLTLTLASFKYRALYNMYNTIHRGCSFI